MKGGISSWFRYKYIYVCTYNVPINTSNIFGIHQSWWLSVYVSLHNQYACTTMSDMQHKLFFLSLPSTYDEPISIGTHRSASLQEISFCTSWRFRLRSESLWGETWLACWFCWSHWTWWRTVSMGQLYIITSSPRARPRNPHPLYPLHRSSGPGGRAPGGPGRWIAPPRRRTVYWPHRPSPTRPVSTD